MIQKIRNSRTTMTRRRTRRWIVKNTRTIQGIRKGFKINIRGGSIRGKRGKIRRRTVKRKFPTK
jgi:hypothetical protein